MHHGQTGPRETGAERYARHQKQTPHLSLSNAALLNKVSITGPEPAIKAQQIRMRSETYTNKGSPLIIFQTAVSVFMNAIIRHSFI